jgi:hypothetical protein
MSNEHHNKLTPAHAEWLAWLAEEASEVVGAAMKILRHGPTDLEDGVHYDNWALLEKEMGQLKLITGIGVANVYVNEQNMFQAAREKMEDIAAHPGRLHHLVMP